MAGMYWLAMNTRVLKTGWIFRKKSEKSGFIIMSDFEMECYSIASQGCSYSIASKGCSTGTCLLPKDAATQLLPNDAVA